MRLHLSYSWGLVTWSCCCHTSHGMSSCSSRHVSFRQYCSVSIWRVVAAHLRIPVSAPPKRLGAADLARQLPPCMRAPIKPSRPSPACLLWRGCGETSHCFATDYRTTPTYHQYFLHTGRLSGSRSTYQQPQPRLRAYRQRVHTVIVTSLFVELLHQADADLNPCYTPPNCNCL